MLMAVFFPKRIPYCPTLTILLLANLISLTSPHDNDQAKQTHHNTSAKIIDCIYVITYYQSMAPRARTWTGHEDAEGHKVTMIWPKLLWREIQHLALEENTSATALMIEAAEMLLAARRKEKERKSDKKK